MSAPESILSEKSRRIARNTLFLYARMLVLLLIGLFTYRIVLRSLGISDYGIYSAVGGVVTMSMLVMTTVSNAISRYLMVALGEGDARRQKVVFGTSLAIMAGFCLLILVLVESAGLWYLHAKMSIPPERMGAAAVVLHASALLLVVQLLTTPYLSLITAHERMDAYAYLGILEAVLKLGVALLIAFSAVDRLVLYVWLLLAVGLLSRAAYVAYAAVRFPESRLPFRCEGVLMKEMGAFAGWNFLGSGSYMLGTQGVNQLMNVFFGVSVNAARGIAHKVEQVVRQFATNIAVAVNPPLVKSYVGGSKEYAFELVCKGAKYYFWILWVLTLPFLTDAPAILRLWLGTELPPEAALFTRLTLLCFLVDFTPNTLVTLEQAHGKIRRFYLTTSAVTVLVFPLTWMLYRAGMPVWTAYFVFISVYLLKDVVLLLIARRDTGFSIRKFLREALLPMGSAVLPSLLAAGLLMLLLPPLAWRFLLVALVGALAAGLGVWWGGLTPGEKKFVRSKLVRK